MTKITKWTNHAGDAALFAMLGTLLLGAAAFVGQSF